MQLGAPFETAKKSPDIKRLNCAARSHHGAVFDEVCFFESSGRLSGTGIHNGFIVRKGRRLVLIGTGMKIKDVDDPRAEAVMRKLQTQVHAHFQQSGDAVLFVDLPDGGLTARGVRGFSQQLPVLLVALQSRQTKLSVLYGFVGPVNAFTPLVDD